MEFNKEKLVTIFFPSRGRLSLVEKLLSSIEEKTYNKDWIEVIAICDQDDDETIDFFKEKSKTLSYDFYYVVRPLKEPFNLSKNYHSLAARMSSDAYFLWTLGNDCEILTEEWDLKFYGALLNFDTGKDHNVFELIENDEHYFYITLADGAHWDTKGNISKYRDQSCCFPMLSKNYCNKAKEFLPEQKSSWGADTWMYWIIMNSPKFTNLKFYPHLAIWHYCMHNKTYEQDDISKNMEKVSLANSYDEDLNFDFTKYRFLNIERFETDYNFYKKNGSKTKDNKSIYSYFKDKL